MSEGEKMMRSTYEPSAQRFARQFLADLWHDLPFLAPAIFAIGFGLVLLGPADSFRTADGQHAIDVYQTMARIYNHDGAWGAIFAAAGAFYLYAYLIDLRLYLRAAAVLFAILSLTACSFIYSAGLTGGTFSFGLMAGLSLWGPKHVAPRV